MKLLQRTGLYFMGFSFVILLIGGLGIFYTLQYMLDHEMDENLHHTRAVLNKELGKMNELPPIVEIMDEVIDIREVRMPSTIEVYKDTFRLVREEGEEELEPFRQYIYTDMIKGKYYQIALNHSKFDSEDLLIAITGLIVGFLLLFLLALNLFNRFLSQKIWQPFYHTIQQIRQYSFSQPNALTALPSTIDEFATLDTALAQMTNKLTKDYQSLKQFTENASHEIQTPLAIIRAQIDLLLQQKQAETSLQHIQQIQQSVTKLSKLNKSLLLLTRIENRQFEPLELIALGDIIHQKLEALDLLVRAKSLRVERDISPLTLRANPILVDIIISNLLTNAIKHNLPDGTISILLTEDKLLLKNTGNSLMKSPSKLFERFQKADDSAKSVGLGLAIVKEICEVYHWGIDYRNEAEWHLVEVVF